MSRLGLPHLIFALFAAAFFVAMGVMALPFPQTAQWFPLYVAVLGTALSLSTAVLSAISAVRTRRSAAESANHAVWGGAADAEAKRGDSQAVIATEAAEAVGLDEDGARPDDDEDDHRTTVRGFIWLAVWLGFVLVGLLIGYIAASAIWIVVWFRTVHKWQWRVLLPVVAAMVALLLLAEIKLNISMPGSDWIRSIVRW